MDKILIKNGTVYDPVLHRMEKREIALAGGEIVPVEGFTEDITIDAKGCLVTPGLIDFHVHCYIGASDGANNVDSFSMPNGVTTAIDGGTAGTANYEGFYQNVVCRSTTGVRALLHVAPEGLTTGRHGENQDPKYWDLEQIHRLTRKHPHVLVGLKVRMQANLLDPFGLHEEPLVEAVKLGEEIGKKVVVHVNNPNVSCGRVAQILRPGDVFCHMYAGNQENILNPDGTIQDDVKKARERGVIFDACNGRGNFLFQVAEPAMRQGFVPDIVSSDVNPMVFYKHPMISLPRVLSKYLAMGMPLADVLDTATLAPARWIGEEDLASTAEGTIADIAIWKLKEKPVCHLDVAGRELRGNQVLVPQMTIREGVIVYCQSDFL